MHKVAGQHSLNYPPSFLSRYLERLVRRLVYLIYQRGTKFFINNFSLSLTEKPLAGLRNDNNDNNKYSQHCDRDCVSPPRHERHTGRRGDGDRESSPQQQQQQQQQQSRACPTRRKGRKFIPTRYNKVSLPALLEFMSGHNNIYYLIRRNFRAPSDFWYLFSRNFAKIEVLRENAGKFLQIRYACSNRLIYFLRFLAEVQKTKSYHIFCSLANLIEIKT